MVEKTEKRVCKLCPEGSREHPPEDMHCGTLSHTCNWCKKCARERGVVN